MKFPCERREVNKNKYRRQFERTVRKFQMLMIIGAHFGAKAKFEPNRVKKQGFRKRRKPLIYYDCPKPESNRYGIATAGF